MKRGRRAVHPRLSRPSPGTRQLGPTSFDRSLSVARVSTRWCVKPRTGHTYHDVAINHATRTEHSVLAHTSDDEPGEIVIRRCVDTWHFSGLAAKQRTVVLFASRGNAGNNRFDYFWLQFRERYVVQEEQRPRALNENIVDAVIDEIVTDSVVPVRFDGDPSLGANTICGGDKQGIRNVCRHLEQTADAPNAPRTPDV